MLTLGLMHGLRSKIRTFGQLFGVNWDSMDRTSQTYSQWRGDKDDTGWADGPGNLLTVRLTASCRYGARIHHLGGIDQTYALIWKRLKR